MKKIGILEDDDTLGRELTYYLNANGYEARHILPEEYAVELSKNEIQILQVLAGCGNITNR